MVLLSTELSVNQARGQLGNQTAVTKSPLPFTTDIPLATKLTQSLRQAYSRMQPQRLAATGACNNSMHAATAAHSDSSRLQMALSVSTARDSSNM